MFTLDNIEEGMLVVATDEYYKGLAGYINEVRRDKDDFETENETELEIVTDLTETKDMGTTHSDLNGTSVSDLIMGEDELIFFPNGPKEKGYDINGNEYRFAEVLYQGKTYKGQFM